MDIYVGTNKSKARDVLRVIIDELHYNVFPDSKRNVVIVYDVNVITAQELTTIINKIYEIEGVELVRPVLGKNQTVIAPPIAGIHSKRIFIVHGKDNNDRQNLARIIERYGIDLKPVILGEQPTGGQTIIQQLQKEGTDAGYCFVLVTPDDIGKWKNDPDLKSRPRQNVVFEWGLCIGRMGQERVCGLIKGRYDDIEIPSDCKGLRLHSYHDTLDEIENKIKDELVYAGYKLR